MNIHPTKVKILTWSSKDGIGLLSGITAIVSQHGGNLLEVVQHTDSEKCWFFLRCEIDTTRSTKKGAQEMLLKLKAFSSTRDATMDLRDRDYKPPVAILVSKRDHCLTDILWRWEAGDLPMHPAVIISNHRTLSSLAKRHKIPFEYNPIIKSKKNECFESLSRLLKKHKVHTIILARYMQILPKEICDQYRDKIINIHHSFLPSFVGANPYSQAHKRGVKIIGATCHYVTEQLDCGPIIEQEVQRVRHDLSIKDLIRLGQDCERLALAKGLRLHLESKVFTHSGKTIILGN